MTWSIKQRWHSSAETYDHFFERRKARGPRHECLLVQESIIKRERGNEGMGDNGKECTHVEGWRGYHTSEEQAVLQGSRQLCELCLLSGVRQKNGALNAHQANKTARTQSLERVQRSERATQHADKLSGEWDASKQR